MSPLLSHLWKWPKKRLQCQFQASDSKIFRIILSRHNFGACMSCDFLFWTKNSRPHQDDGWRPVVLLLSLLPARHRCCCCCRRRAAAAAVSASVAVVVRVWAPLPSSAPAVYHATEGDDATWKKMIFFHPTPHILAHFYSHANLHILRVLERNIESL